MKCDWNPCTNEAERFTKRGWPTPDSTLFVGIYARCSRHPISEALDANTHYDLTEEQYVRLKTEELFK